MAMSKLDVAVVIVAAAVLLRIEHDHRIFIGTPAAAAPAAAVCPAKDDVPFSADCIKFIEGGAPPIRRARLTVVAVSPDARDDPHVPACPPNNENAPYSANCIKFLSGPDWQANPADETR
jgi:hypothetical protein